MVHIEGGARETDGNLATNDCEREGVAQSQRLLPHEVTLLVAVPADSACVVRPAVGYARVQCDIAIAPSHGLTAAAL